MRFLAFVVCLGMLLATPGCERPLPKTDNSENRGQTSPTASKTVAVDFTQIDKILQDATPQMGGGLAVILIRRDRVVYRKAFGSYNIEQTIPIASSSKWLAGALVMVLVDEGKLSLDDPVSKYLPAFTGDKAAITVRHLFAHTSGLPAETSCRNNRQTTLAACATRIAKLKLNAPPGSQFFYGGVSMHAGGRVIEVAGGKTWNDLFLEKISTPLGMSRSDFFAYGPTSNPRPAGDARSTLDDYGKFLQMILNDGELNGRRILSARAIDEMHGDQSRGSSIEYTIFGDKGHLDADLPQALYGVGMWREKINSTTGDVVIASSPGALGSYPWVDFETGTAGAIFTRSTFSRSLPVYLRLREAVRQIADQF